MVATAHPHRLALAEADPTVFGLIRDEEARQNANLELIASENIASLAVREAMASVLTDKYAEGYPGARYYGGCEVVDVVENLARDRAKELFGAEYANVQPHSGSQANTAVYFTFLKPGDTVMGMDLSHGGHLTHGSPVNFSGQLYHFVPYGIDPETELLDYDAIAAQALGGAAQDDHRRRERLLPRHRLRPLPRDRRLGRRVPVRRHRAPGGPHRQGAPPLAPAPRPRRDHHDPQDPARPARRPHPHGPGLREPLRPEGGEERTHVHDERASRQDGHPRHPGRRADARRRRQGGRLRGEPHARLRRLRGADHRERADALSAALVERGFKVVSGGTDNHLMLLDLRNKDWTGKAAQAALDEAGITCNKNAVPFDDKSPLITSGIRLGTPAVTTRGMDAKDMERIADAVSRVIDREDPLAVRDDVRSLTSRYPIH